MKKKIMFILMCLISISMIAQGYNTSQYGANSNFAISAGVVQPRLYHTEGISTFNISYHGGISSFIYTSTSAIIEPGVNFVYKYSN